MVSGIETAGTLSGHVYGTGEPERKCKGKRMKTEGQVRNTDIPFRGGLSRSSYDSLGNGAGAKGFT